MWSVANVVTGARLAPFAVFIFAAHRGHVMPAAVLFAVAWGLDGIDGWLARRFNQTTSFGYIFDKVVDRLILVGGLLALLVTGLVPLYALALVTKDVLLIPITLRRGMDGHSLRSLGTAGRVFTLMQGAAVLWLLLAWPLGLWAAMVVGFLGLVIAIFHLRSLR